ncbi:MAG: hypothetical protein A4E35_00651 [Methanoregula sp. PtaU1.Bin051]|nr:MAG: hypothetical protein A4E35_00651 [Methanoregula sp. PtaU1.Bin051]
MKIGFLLTALAFALALLCMAGVAAAEEDTSAVTDGTLIADEIAPYDGPVGPGNPLYGLKIAFEDLDESFTFNETERLNKEMNNARLRLSEVKRELLFNNTDSADRALDLYRQKINATQLHLSAMPSSNATGLLHAQEMIMKHQATLERLMLSRPDNAGLARAYDNSLALENKFEERTQVRFERIAEKNNRTILKAVRLEVAEQERTENAGETQTVKVRQTQQIQQAERTEKTDTPDQGKNVTERQSIKQGQTAGTERPAPSPTATRGNGGDSGPHNTGNSGNGNNGQGNGRNR